MHQYRSTLIYGFAIFAMFFGSGNLVFPIQIGYLTGANWLLGFCGLFITGILLPFLGLFVIKLYKGNYLAFFNEAGKFAGFLIPLFTLSLLGSFAVIPRCIIVAYGSIEPILPELSLMQFSLIFSIITFLCCLKDKVMMSLLGKWMSPILLAVLLVLIIAGLRNTNTTYSSSEHAFKDGFLIGYQTMDLFAAFFFSALVFNQIQAKHPNENILRIAIQPSILSAILLSSIYLGFVFLGAHYSHIISNTAPESMLPTIAQYILGKDAALIIALAMFFSCITTAVALNNIYSRYLCKLLNLQEKRFWMMLLVTTSIAFLISLLDFNGIAKFLAPILMASYPGLIALTIISIITRNYRKLKITIFYGLLILMIIRMSV